MLHWLIIALQIVEYDEQEKVEIHLISRNQKRIDLIIQIPYKYDFDNQTIQSNEYICCQGKLAVSIGCHLE